MARRNSFVWMMILFLVSVPLLGCGGHGKIRLLTISSSVPATGTVGTAYSGTLTVSGGNGAYTWTPSGVPTGVVVSGTNLATLTLAGTPTAAGSFSFSATVTDTRGDTQSVAVTIVIAPAGVTIAGAFAPTGVVGIPYTGSLSVTGGTAPYTWVVTGFPGSFTITGANTPMVTVSGTPSATATYNVSATVTDSAAHTANAAATVVISPAAQTLTISPTTLGTLTHGVAITPITVTATPATTAPYTWTVASGTIPAGLVLNNGTTTSPTTVTSATNSITISGTPAGSGTYTFILTVTDSAAAQGGGQQTFTGTVTGGTTTAATCESPTSREDEAALTTPFAFLLKGAESDDSPIAWVGSFTPDGNGGITNADLDVITLDDGAESFQIQLSGSSYSYGADGRGCLYLAFQAENAEPATPAKSGANRMNLPIGNAHRHVKLNSGDHSPLRSMLRSNSEPHAQANVGTVAFSFTVGSSSAVGRIIQFDYANSGIVAAGQMHQQTPGDFALGSLSANFAFGLDGWFNTDGSGDIVRTAVAGTFADAAGTLSLGVADYNVNGTLSGQLSGGTGTLATTPPSATTGRGVGSYTFDNNNLSTTVHFVYYVVNASDTFLLSIDDPTTQNSYILSGRALASDATSTALSGNYMVAFSGLDLSQGPVNVGANYVATGLFQGISGSNVPTVKIFANDAGAFTTSSYPNVTVATDTTTGRTVFTNATGPAPIAYLTSTAEEDGIAGFLVGTDAFASSGFLAFQTSAAPNYSATTLTGTYSFGTSEDIAGVQGASDGVINFSNGGFITYTSTLDSILVSNGLATGATGGVAGNGSYNVNMDGSGSLTATDGSNLGMVFATNGTLVLGVDSTDGGQPLLYVFIEQVIPK
jgi:hypothetical protein